MPTAMIDRDQRDGLYELIRNHLGAIGDVWIALEENEDFATAERLGLRFFPEQTPLGLNYAVVTGTLLADPREGGGPGGTPVLVAGRLSERCSLEDGRASCRGTIIANLIHPGSPPEQPGGSLGARYMP